MEKILLAYDGSPSALNAIGDLARAGLPSRLNALVLSVADVWIPPDSDDRPFPAGAVPSVEASIAAAQETLAAAHTLAEAGAKALRHQFPSWNVVAEAVADSPAWAIVRRAESWEADLVALGSHGHSLLERFMLGSVSQRVIAEAPCSVHVARTPTPSATEPTRLLLAIDGSAESEQASHAVAARRWKPGTLCHLVSVLDPRSETAAPWSHRFVQRWMHRPEGSVSVKDAIQRMTEQAAAELRDHGLTVTTAVRTGDPKHELAHHAREIQAHLLILGARGLHHQQRYLIGTVASGVASRAPCSVEVIRVKPAAVTP